MNVTGVVMSVSLSKQIKKKGGGTYNGWELVYRSDDDEVKTIAKPVQGLQYNPALKNSLEQLSAGDEFTANMEKNDGGYWDIKSVVKGRVAVEPSLPSPSPAAKPQAGSNYQGRDYESKEERTAKQKYIIKQSSLSAAVAVLTVGAKTPPKTEDILSLADIFVDYVFDKVPLKPNESGFEDFDDDIPL